MFNRFEHHSPACRHKSSTHPARIHQFGRFVVPHDQRTDSETTLEIASNNKFVTAVGLVFHPEAAAPPGQIFPFSALGHNSFEPVANNEIQHASLDFHGKELTSEAED